MATAINNLDKLTEQVMLHDTFANTSKAKVKDTLRFIFDTIIENTTADIETKIPGFGKFTKFTSSTSGKSSPKFRPSKTFTEKFAK